MNKQAQLKKMIIKKGVICAIVVAVFAAFYVVTDGMVDDSAKSKADADSALSTNQSQITTLTTQIEKTGKAEKQFLETVQIHTNPDFTANTDTLKEYLRTTKGLYRLSNTFKLSLTPDKLSASKEFDGMNYEVYEHPNMTVEFSAISDVHLFSFILDMMHNAPGFIRVDGLSIKRLGDITPAVITQMSSGAAPFLVDVKLTFNWIGFREKVKEAPAAPVTGGAH